MPADDRVRLQDAQPMSPVRNLGLHRRAGPKRRADQGNKCDENRTHLESDDNLSTVVTYFLSIRTKFSVCTAQRLRPDREVQNERGLSVCGKGAKDSRFPESRSYVFCVADLYHRSRTHLSLGKDSPEPRLIEPREMGRVVALPQVGGLCTIATNDGLPERTRIYRPTRSLCSAF
jgi:hypothetical protein